jgi:TP901 family phage tail tape measure protein
MAFDQSYIIKAIDQYTPVLKKINTQLTKFDEKARKTNVNFAKIGQKVSKLGRGISMKLGAPIVAFGTLAIKTAFDFQKSMNMTKAVTHATSAQFEQLRQQAMYLGQTTQFTARQAASAMTFLGLAGLKTNEVLGAMPSVLQLAAAAQIDMGEAANISTSILAGYSLKVKDLAHVNDLLAATFTNTKTNLQLLGQSFKRLGPFAKSAGIPLKETTAVLGQLSNTALGGAIGGRAFKRAIMNMQKPTATGAKIMKLLNLQFLDAHGKMLPLVPLFKKLGALQEKGVLKPAGFTALFGAIGGPAMQAVIGQGTDKLGDFVKMLGHIDGTAKRIAKTQMEGLPGALFKLRAAFEHVQLAIEKTNDTFVIKFMGTLTKLILKISNLSPGMRKLIAEIGGILIVAGPFLMVFGKILGLLVLFRGISIGTALAIGGITIAITALVIGFIYLYQHSKKFRDSIYELGIMIDQGLIKPMEKGYEIAKKVFSFFSHKFGFAAPATSAPAYRSFPTGAVTSLAFVPGAATAAPSQSVKSSLHIKVQDDNKIIKSITGESDADDFGMATGLNMFMAR